PIARDWPDLTSTGCQDGIGVPSSFGLHTPPVTATCTVVEKLTVGPIRVHSSAAAPRGPADRVEPPTSLPTRRLAARKEALSWAPAGGMPLPRWPGRPASCPDLSVPGFVTVIVRCTVTSLESIPEARKALSRCQDWTSVGIEHTIRHRPPD